jgi:hypothetical protein
VANTNHRIDRGEVTMMIAEKIQQHVQQLPAAFQAEVLDFIEYLLAKSNKRAEDDWSDLSLTLAMRGMEDEDTPRYTIADLKVVFA